jgi:hypothetical protein
MITEYRIARPCDTLSARVNTVSRKQRPDENPLKGIPDTYPFKNHRIVGESTCYYIGNNVVATAGHCVFQVGDVIKPGWRNTDVNKSYVVFNLLSSMLTQSGESLVILLTLVSPVYCGDHLDPKAAPDIPIPVSQVFIVDRYVLKYPFLRIRTLMSI